MSVTFWEPKEQAPIDAEVRQLAKRIITASDPMPDPDKYMLYLLGLKKEVLQDRLAIIESQNARDPYRQRDAEPKELLLA